MPINLHSRGASQNELPSLGYDHPDSNYKGLLRFFTSQLLLFLRIYAPNGLTRIHAASLGLVLGGGPHLALRADGLDIALGLFKTSEVEGIDGFERLVVAQLTIYKENESVLRNMSVRSSPASYRPICHHFGMDSCKSEHLHYDHPIYIDNENTVHGYHIEIPSHFSDVYVENCRMKTIYICGAVPAVFISHCNNSLIFVGAAHTVHIEFCANCRVVVAARMFHIDSSIRCTAHLLVNTHPLITGTCPSLVFAPYNALYRRLSLDLLSVGISPVLNLWNAPVLLASLGASPPEFMPPKQFALLYVPFDWSEFEPIVNAIVPPEYAQCLEEKQEQIANLKRVLDVIQEKAPSLYERIVAQMRHAAARHIKGRGQVGEFVWLKQLERQLGS
jgi:TBCC domain-containing protein 1